MDMAVYDNDKTTSSMQDWRRNINEPMATENKMMTEPNPMGCHLATILLTSLQANAFNNWNNISKITHVFLDTFCIYARTGALRKARLWATNSGIEGDDQMSIDNVIRYQTEKKINDNGNELKQQPHGYQQQGFKADGDMAVHQT